jgi:hypothetical protein
MPSDWRWVAFPLAPGKSWDMKFHESRPADRQTEEIERRCVAEAEEAVTVPAGTFPTVRVRCTNARNDAWLVTIWYSPQVTYLVREDAVVTGGKRVRELLAALGARGVDRETGPDARTPRVKRYPVMPSSFAAVPPSIAPRSASLKPGALRMWSTEVLVHGNG